MNRLAILLMTLAIGCGMTACNPGSATFDPTDRPSSTQKQDDNPATQASTCPVCGKTRTDCTCHKAEGEGGCACKKHDPEGKGTCPHARAEGSSTCPHAGTE